MTGALGDLAPAPPPPPAGLLTGKVAIITGASRGIGASAARSFSAAGATVVLAARSSRDLRLVQHQLQASGGTVLSVPTDVTDPLQVAHLVEQTLDRFGRLDAAFNNAGAAHTMLPTADLPLTEWDGVLRLKLTGTFLCLQHQIPAMLATGGGAIVNMASTAGLSARAGLSGYVAANAGVIGLTMTAAVEYADQGIRLNTLAPGPTLTTGLAAAPQSAQQRVAAGVPLRRLGHPADIAAAAAWLCSDQAAFITGTTVTIDGGRLAAGA